MDSLYNPIARYVVLFPLDIKYPVRFFNFIGLLTFAVIPKVLKMIILLLFGSHQNCVLFLHRIIQVVNFSQYPINQNNPHVLINSTKYLGKNPQEKIEAKIFC